MINLLPVDEIQKNLIEYRRRKLIIAGILALVVWLVALIVLGLTTLHTRLERLESGRRLAAVKAEVERVGLQEISADLARLDKQVTLLDGQVALRLESLTPALHQLSQYKTPRVRLQSLTYERPAPNEAVLKLAGLANLRADFLDFVAGLRQDPLFTSVDSPISNLIRDREVSFTLILRLGR